MGSRPESFEACTFIHRNPTLPSGAAQADISGRPNPQCRFVAGPEVVAGERDYFVRVAK